MKSNVALPLLFLFLILNATAQLDVSSPVSSPQGRMVTPIEKSVNNWNFVHQLSEQEWDGTEWDSLFLSGFTHIYSNGTYLQKEEFVREWNGSAWVNAYKYTYDYDNNNNMIEMIYQEWSGGQWVNIDRYVYVYNSNNLLTEYLLQEWNGSWQNYDRTTYTYSNNLETYQLTEIWNGTSWQNYRQGHKTYNSSNQLTEIFYEIWSNSAWSNMGLTTYEYNGNNLIEQISRYWNGVNNWINQSKLIYNYTTSNKVSESITQFWTNSQWGNSARITYFYDADDNLSEYYWQKWENSSWLYYRHYLYTYLNYTSLRNYSDNPLLLTNYPNPFSTSTTILYKIERSQHVKINVYDVNGIRIATLVDKIEPGGTYRIPFTTGGNYHGSTIHCSGNIYMVEIIAGSEIMSRKMISTK